MIDTIETIKAARHSGLHTLGAPPSDSPCLTTFVNLVPPSAGPATKTAASALLMMLILVNRLRRGLASCRNPTMPARRASTRASNSSRTLGSSGICLSSRGCPAGCAINGGPHVLPGPCDSRRRAGGPGPVVPTSLTSPFRFRYRPLDVGSIQCTPDGETCLPGANDCYV